MLAKGYLAGGAVYSTYAYTDKIIESYLEAADDILNSLGRSIKENKDISKLLKGPVKHSGFKRLT